MTAVVIDYSEYPRSALKSQVPIGWGTPVVESLDGYLERLVSALDVPRKSLECYVSGDNDPQLRREGRVEPIRPDSPWRSSKTFAATLAELTQQPSVERLGLGWLHGVLARAEATKAEVCLVRSVCQGSALRSCPGLPANDLGDQGGRGMPNARDRPYHHL